MRVCHTASGASVDVVQTLKKAIQKHRGGAHEDARGACASVLKREPEHAGAHHLLGVFHKTEGNLDAAETHLRRAVALDGFAWHYHASLGNLLDERHDWEGAVTSYSRAAQYNPSNHKVRYNLAVTLGRLGRTREAADRWREMLALVPGSAVARFQLGNACYALGEYEEAARSYEAVLADRPRNLDVINNLASAQTAMGKLEAAAVTLRRGLAFADPGDPRSASLHANLGAALALSGQVEAPTACYQRALAVDPGYMPAAVKLAQHLLQQGEFEAARARFQDVLTRAPETPGAVAGLAEALERQGEITQAMTLVREHMDLAASEPNLAAVAAVLCRREGAPEQALPLVSGLLARGLPDPQRVMLLHHLGHLQDALGEHDAAFAAWSEANALRGLRFDEAAWRAEVEDVQRRGPPARVEEEDERPVLIVGMPRSGTSLVEQILGCHPEVHAGGELEYLRLMAERPGAEPEGLSRFYRRRLDQRGGDARRVTDKMPQNFRWLDLAGALLPGARVIHCRRRPTDVALSCFRQNFPTSYDWSTSLTGIAAYHAGYERMMARWLAAPPLPIFEVDYERLVAEPEAVIPEMVAFCGLGWDERCLRPHESRRVVNTASYAQVREPIHTGAVDRAAPYAAHLRPFVEALEALRGSAAA